MDARGISRRKILSTLGVGGALALSVAALAGCGETQIVEKEVVKVVTKEVPVEKIVTQTVEKVVTKEVEKIVTQIVEKEKIVEKVVTAAPAKPAAVTIDVTLPANTPEAQKAFTDVLLKGFMAKFPNVTVKGVFPPYGEWQQKLLVRLAANEEPDVFGVGGFQLPEYAVRGVARPLDELHKRDAEIVKDMAYPEGGMVPIDGKRYGMTRTVYITSLTYNTKLFAAKGITPSTPDKRWTWDQFLENSIKLTEDKAGRGPKDAAFDKANVKVYGYSQRHNYLTVLFPWLYQNGADATDAKGRHSTWTEPKTIEALQFHNDMVYKHNITPTPDQTLAIAGKLYQGDFTQGRAAITMSLFGQESVWTKPSELGYTLEGMANITKVTTGASVLPFQMLIGKSSKVPEEAWQFIVFQITDEASVLAITLQENYGIASNKKYWDKLRKRTFDTHLTDLSPFFDAITSGHVGTIGSSIAWSEWWAASGKHWTEATYDRIKVPEAAKRMQEESDTILNNAYKKLGLP